MNVKIITKPLSTIPTFAAFRLMGSSLSFTKKKKLMSLMKKSAVNPKIHFRSQNSMDCTMRAIMK